MTVNFPKKLAETAMDISEDTVGMVKTNIEVFYRDTIEKFNKY